jgi:hypothetical protein
MAAKLADKKPKVYDSADELDGYISDDAPTKSQKIPDSQVKMNTELFAASNANSQIGAQDARDRIFFKFHSISKSARSPPSKSEM